jgi:hypothetical protein
MHDLIREHARALADRLDPDQDQKLATTRLLDYYQHAAARAGALIDRQARPGLAAAPGAIPAAMPGLADGAQALAWGRCARAVGDVTRAADLLRQALEIFQRIGTTESGDVSRELAALAEAGASEPQRAT